MFKGFPKDTLQYFREIAKNNKREWYLRHKERYLTNVETPARAFVESLNQHPVFKKLRISGAVKSPLFRMARDTRFSPDKTPYKIYNGFSLSRSGLRGDLGVFYFHFQPKECFYAQGFWMPDSKLVTRFRLKAVEEPAAFKKLLKALKKNKLELSDEDSLKRMPRGFEHISDPELQKFLRLKSYMVLENYKESELGSAKLIDRCANFASRAKSLLEFGWRLVDRWRLEGGDGDFLVKLEKKSRSRN